LKQKIILFLISLIGFLSGAVAQSGLGNLEFIENKGQWDSTVRFRADMPNSTFFLQRHGFSILLQNPKDMEALRQALHGIPSTVKNSGNTNKSSIAKKTNQTGIYTATMPPVQESPSDPSSGSGGITKGNSNSGTNTSLVMHSHLYQVEFLNGGDKRGQNP
jgi:hypothetical protein